MSSPPNHAKKSKSKIPTLENTWRLGESVASADVLLIATGDQWSSFKLSAVEDTYSSIGLDSSELSHYNLIEDDENLFFGFWGSAFNQSRDTPIHEGYNIIRSWQQEWFSDTPVAQRIRKAAIHANSEPSRGSRGKRPNFDHDVSSAVYSAFYVLTSNIDGNFIKSNYNPTEVYEINGGLEYWQCAQPCSTDTIWTSPDTLRFSVDPETGFAIKTAETQQVEATTTEKHPIPGVQTVENVKLSTVFANHPTCLLCGNSARPAVLMSEDIRRVELPGASLRWQKWCSGLISVVTSDPKIKVVIIEMGCNRLDPIRETTESLARQLGKQCTMARVHPDQPFPDNSGNYTFIPIPLQPLELVKNLNNLLHKDILRTKPETEKVEVTGANSSIRLKIVSFGFQRSGRPKNAIKTFSVRGMDLPKSKKAKDIFNIQDNEEKYQDILSSIKAITEGRTDENKSDDEQEDEPEDDPEDENEEEEQESSEEDEVDPSVKTIIIGIGCDDGTHRSVSVVDRLSSEPCWKRMDIEVVVKHKDAGHNFAHKEIEQADDTRKAIHSNHKDKRKGKGGCKGWNSVGGY